MVEWSEAKWQYVGNRIRETRNSKGYSQDKLAALSGVSAGRISEIESGKRPGTTFETIVDLADGMDADVGVFLRELPESGETIAIPVISAIPCGDLRAVFPQADGGEVIEVTRSSLPPVAVTKLYALAVSGNSLIGDGVQDGDYLIVQRDAPFVDGGIYVVCVEGECAARLDHPGPGGYDGGSPMGVSRGG
jgi:repressor LexA